MDAVSPGYKTIKDIISNNEYVDLHYVPDFGLAVFIKVWVFNGDIAFYPKEVRSISFNDKELFKKIETY